MELTTIRSPFIDVFRDVIGSCKENLTIVSPYVNTKGVDVVLSSLNPKSINLTVVTNLSSTNIIQNVTQPKAFLQLFDNFNRVEMYSLARLHAKTYICDNHTAIVTSANLTSGGLIGNFEYGVQINDLDKVLGIKNDILGYAKLGNYIERELLNEINEESSKIEKKILQIDKSETFKLNELLKNHTQKIDDTLLYNRIKDEKSIHAVFCSTILYVLKQRDNLTTKEIHNFIKEIHPDICDDNIQGIYNGKSYGFKWKHKIRAAQVALKDRGQIINDYEDDSKRNSKWHLLK